MNIMTADLYAWKVLDACNRYLAARQKRIDKVQAELIEQYKKPYFFGMFTRTEEQALAAAQKDDEWYYASCRGAWYSNRVEELKVLCEKAIANGAQFGDTQFGATVTVDAEIVGIIAKFLNVKED
jgi:hypothetical protein